MAYSQNNLNKTDNPYLQQHANNPVHWQEWSDKVFQAAQNSDRLVLVSIGYSSCHWCHVMEKQCFEDTAVAKVMNGAYFSIKVDREERPDLDEHYMTALQLMNGQGGWPLNVICLPDGRPVWGATFVPKDRWIQVLQQLDALYKEKPQEFEDYAAALQEGIVKTRLIDFDPQAKNLLGRDRLKEIFNSCRVRRDLEQGGAQGAPKFPMPGLLQTFQHYAYRSTEPFWQEHLQRSLDCLARGGIYDQIGGGFARYATDGAWKIPHFEKMLYDNAQLLSLYSRAYRESAQKQYHQVIEETLDFLNREMRSEEGLFYSAIDADSEGEEGKFYVWTRQACRQHIPEEEWEAFYHYFGLDGPGHWEGDQYILLRPQNDSLFCAQWNLSEKELNQLRSGWREALKKARAKRPRPFTDEKAITAWNGLMLSGLCEAYQALGDTALLNQAEDLAQQILEKQWQDDQLWRIRFQKQSHQIAFLDDYATLINAWLDLYGISGKPAYAKQALVWTEKVRQDFRTAQSGFFMHRPVRSTSLISNSPETHDNVIPSANALMAQALHRLSLLFYRDDLAEESRALTANMLEQVARAPESHYQWLDLLLQWQGPHFQIALVGPESPSAAQAFLKPYLPHCHLVWSHQAKGLPALKDRKAEGGLRIYICQQRVCQAPTDNINEAFEQLAL